MVDKEIGQTDFIGFEKRRCTILSVLPFSGLQCFLPRVQCSCQHPSTLPCLIYQGREKASFERNSDLATRGGTGEEGRPETK